MSVVNRNNGSLPCSEDGEKGVLCSLLLSPVEVARMCAAKLPAGAFYIPAHQIVFDAILEWTGSGAVGFPWLKQRLKDRNQLEEIGGPESLSSLYSFVPTSANAAHYIEIVREKNLLRRLILTCNKLASQCYDPQEEIASLLADFERELTEIVRRHNGYGTAIERGVDLIAADLPLPPELIVGLLHKTLKGQLAGASKSMKSWALIHLAIAVSLGKPWWGFATTKGRVLFLNLEIPRAFFRQRVQEVANAMQAELDPETFAVMHLRGIDISKSAAWEEVIASIIRAGPWDLLVFDPVYKILGTREENCATDVGQIVMLLERAAELTGASVLYSHHYAKGSAASKESTDRMSGSGVWMRDPDTYLAMTRHKIDGCFVIEPTLRNLPPVDPFVVRWCHPLFERAPELDASQLRQPEKPGSAAKYKAEQIAEILGNRELKTTALKKLVLEETGMGKSTFFDLLREAEALSLISKDGQTETWEKNRNSIRR